MTNSFLDLRRKNLKKRIADLHEEYEVASKELGRTRSDVDRLRLQRQIDDLEQKIQQIEDKLNQITTASTNVDTVEKSRLTKKPHDKEKQMVQASVFISYSHDDEVEKGALLKHLGVLEHAGLVDVWSDDRIGAGANWEIEIEQAMAQAGVAILLITANFLTSDFILSKEVPELLKRRQHEGVVVFPVIAKACAWRQVKWLAEMNVRPKNGRPVWGDGGSHVDEDLATIADEVAVIITQAKTDESDEDVITLPAPFTMNSSRPSFLDPPGPRELGFPEPKAPWED